MKEEPFSHDLVTGHRLAPEYDRAASRHGRRRHRNRRPRVHARRSRPDYRSTAVALRDCSIQGGIGGRPGPADALFRLSLRTLRQSESGRVRAWPKKPAMRACVRPTAGSIFPATTRSTCNASPSTTT